LVTNLVTNGCIDVTTEHGTTTFAVIGVARRSVSTETERRVALHEAAHAVVGRLLDLDCGGASITPDARGYDGHAFVAGHHAIHNEFIASMHLLNVQTVLPHIVV
jgi:ATP-dependent Zn protease